MKRFLAICICLFCCSIAFSQIKWISFEEAMKLTAQDGKPVLIDVYTDWCGWCKRLDATTYQDSAVVQYINTHFHAVKMNAESKEPMMYQDTVYQNTGKTHALAVKLMKGKMSYPTTIFMVQQGTIFVPVPGYVSRESIQPNLFFFGERVYEVNNIGDAFMKGFNAPKF